MKFKVWFESIEPLEEKQLDEMNWIMDYGGFKSQDAEPTPGNGLKDWMNYMFDHTCLIEKDDPQLESFKWMEELGILHLRVMDKMGAESCAKLVYEHFNKRLYCVFFKLIKISRNGITINCSCCTRYC